MSVGGSASTLMYPPFAAAAAFVEVSAGRRSFDLGERGPQVKTLEETLVAVGCGLPGGARPDVAFSQGTRSALMRFQQEKGLPQTGKLEQATLLALDRAIVAKRTGAGPGRMRPGAAAGAAAAPAPARASTVQLMKQILDEAMSADSRGGSRVTKEEIERALGALTLDDGAVSPEEYAAARAAVQGERFQRAATLEAKDWAEDWLRRFLPKPGGAPVAGVGVRRLDAAARDAALGKNAFTREIQMAQGRLDAKAAADGGTDVLIETAMRAFGRREGASFEVGRLEPCGVAGAEQRLARGVDGYRPAPAEVQKVVGHLAGFTGPSGRIFAADWSDRRPGGTDLGTFLIAVKANGTELLFLDLLRKAG